MTGERCYGPLKPAFPINGIVLVGVCAAGKTTVSRLLAEAGIPARPVAQEHSLVPGLYGRGGPHPLVVLAARWDTVHRRRRLGWSPEYYRVQWRRVAGAREQAGLIVHTDSLSAREVSEVVRRWWDERFGIGEAAVRLAGAEGCRLAALRYAVARGDITAVGATDAGAVDWDALESRYREAPYACLPRDGGGSGGGRGGLD